jgi:hypothetical protein
MVPARRFGRRQWGEGRVTRAESEAAVAHLLSRSRDSTPCSLAHASAAQAVQDRLTAQDNPWTLLALVVVLRDREAAIVMSYSMVSAR